MNFHFDASLVAKMAPFVSNEETRYYLHGIHVTADPSGGVRLAATDGKALIVARDPEGVYTGPENGVIIAVDGFKQFVSACRKKARSSIVGYVVDGDTDAGALHVRYAADPKPEFIHPEPFIDCTFPDYARIVPPFSEDHLGTKDTFNPELLNRFRGFGANVTLYQEKIGCPLIVLTPDLNAFGVIMTVRGNNTPPAFWFDQPGKHVAVEKEQAA